MGAISNWLAEVFEDLAERIDLPILSATCSSIAGVCEAVGTGVDNLTENMSLHASSIKDFFTPMGSGVERQGFVPDSMYAAQSAASIDNHAMGLAIEPPAPPSMEQLLPAHALAQVHQISNFMAFNSPSFAMTMDNMEMGYGVENLSLANLNNLNALSTPAFAMQPQQGYSAGMMA